MELAGRADLEPYRTKDGSEIREWAGPGYAAAARNQSLAEATVPVGAATAAHLHRRSEEPYLITAGRGRLRIGEEEGAVSAGDCAVIPPQTVHFIENLGERDLVVVCACSPPYTDEDTVLCDDVLCDDE
jgi:mannose-6-phosphate isomerase-like protein (cupin superfamily)